ncbi:exodeoxyribonuclease V subunit gamma [Spongisporangium articulatum]|uniref:RecBCD enzyme subunit RecC n=1 Tax=Spongisporangium articulatum TaxID=3362603 RepID=A0ABW8AQ05_9ACTN
MLTVHRSRTGEALVAGLAGVLSAAPADPFTPDVVAVPAKGVERWIAQRLSLHLGAGRAGDGVCANVEFPWPRVLLDDAVKAVSAEHATSVERWAPAAARWPLLELLDENLDAGWAATLARYLGEAAGEHGRRMGIATRLASFYDAYGRARPQMLRSWAEGRFETGAGERVPEDLLWQPELWRLLRERLGPAPAELLGDACARLRVEPERVALPDRFSVFGASRLAPGHLAVLAALAEQRDVHLWLHHPSPALWDGVAASPLLAAGGVRRRVEPPARNAFLASMARDLIELQRLLAVHAPAAHQVLHTGPEPPPTLLGRLQGALAADEPDAGAPEAVFTVPPGDRSVQVHACHGRSRQVEVLREVVLGLLAADPTLEPRDVLVMCPDVETFAPLVAAAFSLGPESPQAHPATRLRVRVADRAPAQLNPLLEVLARVLELGTARVTSAEVLDLCGADAVSRRFGFDDDGLERLRGWVADSGVRWGMDDAHRSRWQLDRIAQGTWRAGLDRLLLGVATGGGPFGDVLPLDEVDSSDIDLAGRFAELLDRLGEAVELMSATHPAADWRAGLERAVLALADVDDRSAWQRVQLRDLLEEAFAGGGEAPLGLADVRNLLSDELSGRPTRAGFRTGTLTVCTLVPMRSVPHRVICLIGLDDGSFPRQSVRDGDDLLARDPWIGERDPRSEDRQLLLDAVCAAQQHLVVTYAGMDERTGARVPPAVPLGELLDEIDRVATTSDGRPVRDLVTTRHPLQPFDPRNFGADGGAPVSFDVAALEAARALEAEREGVRPFLPGPLATVGPLGEVELKDLRDLLLHPARGFLAQRLQVRVTRPEDEPSEVLPVAPDALEKWALGERLLTARLAGVDVQECLTVELLRGAVPPGPLGVELVREVGRLAEPIVRASAPERSQPAESRDVDVALPGGIRLTGTVRGLRGDVLLSTTYSRLGPRQRLSAWVDLLALTASEPGRPWRAVAVGRGERGAAARSELGPVAPDDARAAVAELLEVYRAGLRAPLPLPLKTASVYAASRHRDRRRASALYQAGGFWKDTRDFPGERSDDEHVLVHGRGAPLEVLLDEAPWPGEGTGPGWATDEEDRFGLLARRVWGRLLDAERTV